MRRYKKYIALVSIVLLVSVKYIFADEKHIQSSSFNRNGDFLVWEGIYAFYNYEFDKSVKVLSTARNQFPTHPAVHLTWVVAKWLKSQAYDGIEDSYITLDQSLNEAIPIYEDLVDQFPDEPLYKLYLFSSKGFKARVHLGKKEWLRVVIEGIKGYRGVAIIHSQNPELWDSYFPLGMLNFYAGISSPIVRFFAGLFGIKADKEIGLSQISIAAEKGEFSWIEANQALVFIYLWINDDYESSLPIALELRNEFPASIYNQHLYSESLIRMGKLDQAKTNIDLTFEMVKSLPQIAKEAWIPTLKYQRALLEFYQGNYDSSLGWVTESIDEFNAELDVPLGFGYVLRGNIYDIKNERKLAIIDYRTAMELSNYTSAMRQAKRYLEEPFELQESRTKIK